MTTDTWRRVAWSLGGNDQYGDCAFVSCANIADLWAAQNGTPWTIGEAECERFYAVEAGFNSQNKTTDKGEILEKVIKYWCENGWPGDSLLKPSGYEAITADQIQTTLAGGDGAAAWCVLPINDDGDPDLSDVALRRNTPGTAAHAVAIVAVENGGFWIIMWAEPKWVSRAWWNAYGRDCYAVRAQSDLASPVA